MTNIQFDTVKCGIEARDLAGPRRQVGRNNASSVCGQIQGLDSASTPQVQGGFDRSSKRRLQERGRCPTDSQNMIWTNGFSRHVFTKVRQDPPVLEAALKLRRVRTQVVICFEKLLTRGRIHIECGKNQTQVDRATHPKSRQSLRKNIPTFRAAQDKESRQHRSWGILPLKFANGRNPLIAHERSARRRADHGFHRVNAPPGATQVCCQARDQSGFQSRRRTGKSVNQ